MQAVDLEEHRSIITGHCYRMLGSPTEADDAVQETMLRALRSIDKFDGRASLRTWLHRIATNVCLDALADRSRRERPILSEPRGDIDAPLIERPRSHWLEPIPDIQVLPLDASPEDQAIQRESIRLAFVAALQHIPPKQRAALILTEVLGWSSAEVAGTLDTSVASVNSALQRARATLSSTDVTDARAPLTEAQLDVADKFAEAFERYDVDAIAALLREDATLSMPPFALWLRGTDAIRNWLLGRVSGCNGSRLVRTSANGLPAFGQYRRGENGGPHKPWSLTVLEFSGNRVVSWNAFLDTETLFPLFKLPSELP